MYYIHGILLIYCHHNTTMQINLQKNFMNFTDNKDALKVGRNTEGWIEVSLAPPKPHSPKNKSTNYPLRPLQVA